jgi:threonine dehydrogenase-like Zn-dependent dehydrogenase
MKDLLEQEKIDINTLITHRMPFENFDEAVQLAISGNCGKVVLEF